MTVVILDEFILIQRKMPKQKRDYKQLKVEFLKSDFDELKSFITHKWIAYNAERGRRTKWWAKEKQEMKEKILAKATQNVIERQAKELELPMEQLSIAKKNAVIKVIQMMMDKDHPLDMADMERSIKIIRTEMWLPNTYSKNENMNIDKIEWIHIVLWGNPIDNSKDDKNNAL